MNTKKANTKKSDIKWAETAATNYTDDKGMIKNIVNFKFVTEVTYYNEISDVSIVFEWTQDGKKATVDFGAVADFFKLDEFSDATESNRKVQATSEIPLDGVKIDEKWVKNLCDNNCKIYIVNTEEKTLYDMAIQDLSNIFLHDQDRDGKICFKHEIFTFRKQCPLMSFCFSIELDQNLLSTELKYALNPFSIEIDKISNLFINPEYLYKYERLYVKYWFFNKEYTITTQHIDHSRSSSFKHKHVFLLGLEDQQLLRDYLIRDSLYFEVHDKDEIINNVIIKEEDYVIIEDNDVVEEEEDDPKKKGKPGYKKPEVVAKKVEPKKVEPKGKDAKKGGKGTSAAVNMDEIELPEEKPVKSDEMGFAELPLKEQMNPYNLKFRLYAPIYPIKIHNNNERTILDQNATARKKAKELIPVSQYLDQATTIKVNFEIAFPIGGTPEPEKETLDVSLKKSKDPKAKESTAELTESKQKFSEGQTLRMSQKLAIQPKQLFFERVIFIFSYKNAEFMKLIEKIIKEINIQILFNGEADERILRTKQQTKEEKANKAFDFIGGIEIIDRQYRIYILEGVAGGSMKELSKRLPKNNDNTKSFKILRNETMTFFDRMYLEYNCDLKRIKLLRSINTLTERPDIYLRGRVPLEMYNTIMKIKKLREKTCLDDIDKNGLWITSSEQNVFERSYGDSLNEFDLNGIESRRKRNPKSNLSKSRSNVSMSQDKSVASEKTTMVDMEAIRENRSQDLKDNASNSNLKSKASNRDKSSQSMQSFIDEDHIQTLPIGGKMKNRIIHKTPIKKIGKGILKNKGKGMPNDTLITESPENINKRQSGMDSKLNTQNIVAKSTGKISVMTRSLSHHHVFALGTENGLLTNQAAGKRKFDRYTSHQRKIQTDTDQRMLNLVLNDIQPGENVYSAQLRRMREMARNDKDNFYTQSENYLSASIDPYSTKEARNIDNKISRAKYMSKEGIVTIIKKENPQRHRLALHKANIDDLHSEPYHVAKERAKLGAKFKEELIPNVPVFTNFLPPLKHADPKTQDQEEGLTRLEKMEQDKNMKRKDLDDFNKKLVVDSPNFYVNPNGAGTYNTDKYKGILHDPTNVRKKGLLQPNRILNHTAIDMDKAFKPFPVSFNENEKKPTGYKAYQGNSRNFDLKHSVSNRDFTSHAEPPGKARFIHRNMVQEVFKINE